jgi:hypothetical protein
MSTFLHMWHMAFQFVHFLNAFWISLFSLKNMLISSKYFLKTQKAFAECMSSLTNHSESPLSLKDHDYLCYTNPSCQNVSYFIWATYQITVNPIPVLVNLSENSLKLVIYSKKIAMTVTVLLSHSNVSYSSNKITKLLLYSSLRSFECQYFLFSNFE